VAPAESKDTARSCKDEPVTRASSTDDVEIALHDLGGDGPPILFAHATGLHGRVWEPVARRLPGFHAWAVDFRGHGDASAPEGLSYDWQGFGDDVLAAVDALGLDRPFGVGHSKGGAALLLAEEARPGTFEKLWCFDPVVFPGPAPSAPPGTENPLAAGAARRRAVFASRDEAFANYRTKPPFDVVTDEALRAYVEHGFADRSDGTVALKCAPLVEAQVYRMGPVNGAFADLGRVACPVTIARAKVEGMGPAAFAEAIAEALPAGRLVDFPHLTHFGPLQAPDEIAASIETFFATT
jgi:pimeloyl-ACP methyl ester carboxylesterase